jgi:hypothetical protein
MHATHTNAPAALSVSGRAAWQSHLFVSVIGISGGKRNATALLPTKFGRIAQF